MSRKMLLLFALLSFSFTLESVAEEFNPLKRFATPPISEFSEGHFEIGKSVIIGWIQDIETFLQTEAYDLAVRCEINEEMHNGSKGLVLFAWSHVFRQARHPATDSFRLISVRQNLLDNPAIASNNGIAFDNRSHLDILCKGQRCNYTRVTAFESDVSEQVGDEYDKEDKIEELRLRGLFDPCAAATVSPHQAARGYAMDFSEHNFRNHSVRSAIRRGDLIHVLLRFKGSPRECQIATFYENVPIQVCDLEWAEDDESNATLISVTRSQWIAPNGTKQKLPVRIQGVRGVGERPCELIASIDWKIGNDVDSKLFDRSTLGLINPVPESDIGIPLLLR
jgi:hypothetical protein